ncbi:hypothetical protein BKA70DRAFT_1538754 [Coprinopsis sp. MPI-PUGE-AT-0042]|nr:hypothetical protein BKA70DRAFT_1538754 [Coprinopsis sp. MPI-PUGE-AT-0042]
MPAIASNDKVLVTGSNGYVSPWIIQTLLERGNSIRASVRSESKGRVLQELFKSHVPLELEIVVVPDMTKEGAWDEAVKGVQAIQHTATPVNFFVPDPKPEEPAIKGTVRVLESALKYKNDVKRVVITSSIVAVVKLADPPRAYDENDWNESSPEQLKRRAQMLAFMQSAWDFYERHKDGVSWDLITICPPLVIGAPLGEVSSAAELNTSLKIFATHILSEAPKSREMLGSPCVFGDVRDVAEAHVLALEKERAGGERIFVTAGTYIWQDLVDIANKVGLPSRTLSPGFPDLDRGVNGLSISNVKSVEILGLKYVSLEETTRHILEDFGRRELSRTRLHCL